MLWMITMLSGYVVSWLDAGANGAAAPPKAIVVAEQHQSNDSGVSHCFMNHNLRGMQWLYTHVSSCAPAVQHTCNTDNRAGILVICHIMLVSLSVALA